MPRIVLLVATILANVTRAPRTESWRAITIDAPRLRPLLRGPGIFEPVDDVVNVQRFSVPPRLERVQLVDVMLDLLAGRMLVLAEPALKSRQLEFRVEARAHARLMGERQQTRMMRRRGSCGRRCGSRMMVAQRGRWDCIATGGTTAAAAR